MHEAKETGIWKAVLDFYSSIFDSFAELSIIFKVSLLEMKRSFLFCIVMSEYYRHRRKFPLKTECGCLHGGVIVNGRTLNPLALSSVPVLVHVTGVGAHIYTG